MEKSHVLLIHYAIRADFTRKNKNVQDSTPHPTNSPSISTVVIAASGIKGSPSVDHTFSTERNQMVTVRIVYEK